MEKFGEGQMSSTMIISSMNELNLSMIYKMTGTSKVSVGNIIPEVKVEVFLNA